MLQPVLAALAAAALTTAADPPSTPEAPATPAAATAPAPESTRAPVQAPTQPPIQPYLGVGLGVTLPTDGGDSGSALRLRVGVPRSRRLLVGIEAGLDAVGVTRLSYLDVGATFYPWEQWLFLRGALGLSLRSEEVLTGPSGQLAWRVEQGPNLLVGVGSALSRRPGFDLTLNLEYQRHFIGGTGDSLGDRVTHQVTAWVGAEWL